MAGMKSGESKEHTSIDIAALNKVLADSIIGKLLDGSSTTSAVAGKGARCSIYRVHENLRKLNEDAYTPKMISIGPFHHGFGSLTKMEEHKLRYVNAFLSRTANVRLEELVESLRRIELEARQCYSEPINVSSDHFVEMMLVDGLFIIELFRKSAEEIEIEADDPIFNNVWRKSCLIHDLVLLENQIPMCIIKEIILKIQPTVDNVIKVSSSNSLPMLDLSFIFDTLMPRDEKIVAQYEGKHLLDLLGTTYLPSSPHSSDSTKAVNLAIPSVVDPKFKQIRSQRSKLAIPCVTDLKFGGIHFRRSSRGSLSDIKLNHNVLEMPHLIIQEGTECLLRNLIASEQWSDGSDMYVTSYVFLMCGLLKDPEDVKFLRLRGIITNSYGNDEQVVDIFQKLCREVNLENTCYSDLYNQMYDYYNRRRNQWKAVLRRDYFHDPWAFITFAFGIVTALELSLIQTIFTVLSYFSNDHKSK